MASALARQNFSTSSEEGINQQINMEQRASLAYASMSAYFGRDDVALPGLEKFFRHSSNEENEHAQKLIDYLNRRGGRVVLQSIEGPVVEWKSAKNAIEAALQLEKDVNRSLLSLHKIAEESNDPQMTDFLEGEYLKEQVESIKQLSDYVTQLNLVGGDGLGLYLWDRELLKSQE
ncbi:ferritin [Neoconidiobolus thromboides FSU 785]|nr:ferritin [Neoconidiobolus thromboides FSU 785]